MTSSFFAAVSRMKYIERWALMRNARPENLCEHSMEVAVIAHALCTIGNVRFGKQLDADYAAAAGLYHDMTEIITGDMPTPVKYYSKGMRQTYQEVENAAKHQLLEKLPADLRDSYRVLFDLREEAGYEKRLVKAADKLSALIKCIEEEKSGNTEFLSAKRTTLAAVEEIARELPEVQVFQEEFLPAYGLTLDELM